MGKRVTIIKVVYVKVRHYNYLKWCMSRLDTIIRVVYVKVRLV